MSLNPETKMTKARAELVMGHPFFGVLALRMEFKPDKTVKTAVCNGNRLRYNPDYVDSLSVAQTIGLVAAEVAHIAMLHHTRRNGRDAKKWNQACDYATEQLLVEANIELPNPPTAPSGYKDKPAEEIYTLIPDPPKNGGGGGGKGNSGGKGQNQGNDGDNSGGEGDPQNEPGQNDNNGNGEVEDSDACSQSPSEIAAEEADWKQSIAQAMHAAKQAGKMPGSFERMMGEIMEPVLPWKAILKRFMTEKANDDFSWMKGNRRFLANGLYLPSRVSRDAMNDMVVCIDTSGSIGQKELDEFAGEIMDIHKDVRPRKLIVIYCDARVAHVDEFGPEDELHFKIHGGGGTDFRPPFDWLEERGIVPKCFAYLTDGYGPFPEHEPEFPTIWAINNKDVKPPFGEHFVLEVR